MAAARSDLDRGGCSVLRGFVVPAVHEDLRLQGVAVAGRAWYRAATVNVYNTDPDPGLPPGHPAQRTMPRGNAFVGRDDIPKAFLIHRLYTSPLFQQFVAACVGLDEIHPLADPLADLCVNVVMPGREHPWHFDTNEFSVSLLTQSPEQGGIFEYRPHIRAPGAENLDEVAAALAGRGAGRPAGCSCAPGTCRCSAVAIRSPEEHAVASGACRQGPPAWRPIEFVLDAGLRDDIANAGAAFAAYADATACRVLPIDDFGAERAKQLGVSPDAFAQLAFQLAHYRAKGFVGATFESISTRYFHHGRTEAMRVVTPEIVRFVAAVDDPTLASADRAAALRAAADAHVERARQCQSGDAPEQHLWELQLLAERGVGGPPNAEFSALYRSPGWVRMRDDYLSTSAAPSTNIQYFGFGATSAHCIGVAYLLLPERFHIHLSTPRAVGDEMDRFAWALPAAIGQMSDLLSGA